MRSVIDRRQMLHPFRHEDGKTCVRLSDGSYARQFHGVGPDATCYRSH